MGRITSRREETKRVRAEGEVFHVGVDVHRLSYHVAVWSTQRGLVDTWVQPSLPEVVIRRLKPLGKAVHRVVYEAGPTGYSLARRLREAGYAADVIAPSLIPQAPGVQPKCDRLDCRRLAQFAAQGLLRAVHVPTREEAADRQVTRLRDQMLRKRRSVRQQIKSFLLFHGLAEPVGLARWSKVGVEGLRRMRLPGELRFCLHVLLEDLAHTQAQVELVTHRIKRLAQAPRHRAAVEILKTVPGVAVITAMSYQTELVAPGRFHHPREVSRMLGLAPQVSASGQTRHGGPIMKSGNSRLRTLLVEAAWRWVRLDTRASGRYRRLVVNTGSSKKAIVGMARRLGIILWRMSTRKEAYRIAG